MSETNVFLEKVRAAAKGRSSDDPDADDEYTACAFGRVGTRPQVSVTFRQKDGSAHCFAYSHFYCLTDDRPNVGFTVEFTRHRVRVEGRNLARVAQLLCDYKARDLVETDEVHALLVAEREAVILTIDVQSKRPDEEA